MNYAGREIVEEFKALFELMRSPVAPVGALRHAPYVTFLVLVAPLVYLTLVKTTPIQLLIPGAHSRARQKNRIFPIKILSSSSCDYFS